MTLSTRRWIVVAAVVVAALIAVLSYPRRPKDAPVPVPGPPAPASAVAPPPVPDGVTVVEGTDFDRRYLAADGTVEDDLKAVSGLLDAAAVLVKDLDRFPLPDNVDITGFLRGKNPHRVAWIRPGHRAVSPQGELLDRWGSPLFFHRESSRATTLRSAGPDRVMWNDDDVLWPKP